MSPSSAAARRERDERRSDPDDGVQRARRQFRGGDREPLDPQATRRREPQPAACDDGDPVCTRWDGKARRDRPLALGRRAQFDVEVPGRGERRGSGCEGEGDRPDGDRHLDA
jgi:hypothetical protein